MSNNPGLTTLLDNDLARDIAGYIARRNGRKPLSHATLSLVCKRFRLRQKEVIRIINTSSFLHLSNFAYKPPSGGGWGEILTATWFPQEWAEAPKGQKLVIASDE